jgi:hypothetical protein
MLTPLDLLLILPPQWPPVLGNVHLFSGTTDNNTTNILADIA